MLEFDQVSHSYSSRSMFRDLSLRVSDSRTIITGPNGSGKTTLLLLAAGILPIEKGSIELNGESVTALSSKLKIGVSASKVDLPGFLTTQELLDFHASQFNKAGLNRGNISEADIHSWAKHFNIDKFLFTKVTNLSLGNYKKLSLILALIHQPELLLLDEPTNGLDEQGLGALAEIVKDFSGQILIASHEANSGLFTHMSELAISELVASS